MGYWDDNMESDAYDSVLEEYDDDAEYEYVDEYEIDDEFIEEVTENSAYGLNKKEAKSVYSARIRLEQARLYEMLINHNVFDGVEASDEAIKKVQEDLKTYIVDRLEVLLGIKKKKMTNKLIEEKVVVETTFNDVEIEFLKALAYKGTKGESSRGVSVLSEQRPKAINLYTKQEIKPISQPKPLSKPKPIKVKAIVEPVKIEKEEPLLQTPQKKKKRKVKKKVIKRVSNGMEKGSVIYKNEAERIAMEEIAMEKKILKKAGLNDLSHEDAAALMIERNKDKGVKRPANALPPPNERDLDAYSNTVNTVSQNAGGFMGALVNASLNE